MKTTTDRVLDTERRLAEHLEQLRMMLYSIETVDRVLRVPFTQALGQLEDVARCLAYDEEGNRLPGSRYDD